MKKVMLFMMLLLFTVIITNAQSDTLEYKEVHLYKLGLSTKYRMYVDNNDGTTIDYNQTYPTRVAALNVYTSQGWKIVVQYFDNTNLCYLLERKITLKTARK